MTALIVIGSIYLGGIAVTWLIAVLMTMFAIHERREWPSITSQETTERRLVRARNVRRSVFIWPAMPFIGMASTLRRGDALIDEYRSERITREYKEAERAYEREFGRQLRRNR